MRHARHNHGTGPAGAWPSLVASATAVSGVLLTTLGGGEAAADAGTGVAALGGVVVGGVLLVRARECAARQAEVEETRRAEHADHARELAKRDTRIDELAEEVTAVTDDSGVLRRQMDELRDRFDDEMSFRVRLETEFDRLAEWARGELGRASITLEATRDQLEQALHRAAEAEAELTAAPDDGVMVAAADGEADTNFTMARQALDRLWAGEAVTATADGAGADADATEPVMVEAGAADTAEHAVLSISALMAPLTPGEVSFDVAEPLPDVYRVAMARSEAGQADAESTRPLVAAEAAVSTGERLYRPFVLGVVTEDDPADQIAETVIETVAETPAERTQQLDATTTIDLTAYDETAEFSVRSLRSARHSA